MLLCISVPPVVTVRTLHLNPEKHKMGDEQKRALLLLEDSNYVVLSSQEQLDYYSQRVQSEFRKSVGGLVDHAEALARSDDGENDG